MTRRTAAHELLALPLADALAREREHRPAVAETEASITDLIRALLSGDAELSAAEDPGRPQIGFHGIAPNLQATLSAIFDPQRQRAAGASYLRDFDISGRWGVVLFPSLLRRNERYANGLALTWQPRLTIDRYEHLLAWAVLAPLYTRLLSPIIRRAGGELGLLGQGGDRVWDEVIAEYDWLGIAEPASLIEPFRYDRRWVNLRAAEIVALKLDLLESLARAIPDDLMTRFRLHQQVPLLERYVAKMRHDGGARRADVLLRRFEYLLSGFFAGSWEQFVAYIDPDASSPQVATRVHRTPEIPELSHALAAPRLAALNDFWAELEGSYSTVGPKADEPLLPEEFGLPPRLRASPLRDSPELLGRIDELWGTEVIERWPERLVTSPMPFAGMCGAFGPALEAWDRMFSRVGYFIDGGMDADGLRRDVAYAASVLLDAGAPVSALLADIEREIATLPQRQRRVGITIEGYFDNGDEASVAVTGPADTSKIAAAESHERASAILNAHRRAWAEQHLERLLADRWRSEFERLAESRTARFGEREKTLTAKQFSGLAAGFANRFAAGRLDLVAPLVSGPVLDHPNYERLMPTNVRAFVRCVRRCLGEAARRVELDYPGRVENEISKLASRAPAWVQLKEGTNRHPTLAEFGRAKFEYFSIWADTPDAAWALYADLVVDCLAKARASGERDADELSAPGATH
jgi:hypothetical protein